MQKFFILFVVIFCNVFCFAQFKSGIVEYEIAKVDVPFKEGTSQNDMVKSLIAIAKIQKYQLKFNNNFSSFNMIETLNKEQFDENLVNLAKIAYATSDSYFLDGNNNKFITKTDDNILVSSETIKTGWKISTETKMIDTYLCYKAIYMYEFVTRDNKIKTKTITAWFAPSLPFAFGPIEFHGLPGLILELNKNYTTYLATKITLLDEDIKIDFPKGKTITKDEYEKAILKN